jgi:hypothetical protein
MHFNTFFVKIMRAFLSNSIQLLQNWLLLKQHKPRMLDFLQFVTYKSGLGVWIFKV